MYDKNIRKTEAYIKGGFLVIDDYLDKVLLDTNKYPLTKVTKDELFDLRLRYKTITRKIKKDKSITVRKYFPIFILKENNSYYYADIPYNTKFLNVKLFEGKSHLCVNCDKCLPSRCEKIYRGSVNFQINHGLTNYQNALLESQRIEDLDFISLAFETANTSCDVLMVACCKFFVPIPKVEHKKDDKRYK